jgi:flavin-dependent dehydrogenase
MADAYDVAVIGAGIAGLTSAVFLQKAGLRVVCLDTRAYPHHKVGESLDWSSPNMLQRVGIARESLIADQIATYKKGIMVCEPGKADWDVEPPPSIKRSPLRFETVTLHVDRTALDQRLYELAVAAGTTFIWEGVSEVDVRNDRVRGCVTHAGRRIEARHYIDASGTALVFARAMKIPTQEYGRPKVCLWTYFKTPPLQGGTTFFLDSRDDYLNWLWDIPISPTETSVGLVIEANVVKAQRRAGRSLRAILSTELARHKRFDKLLAEQPEFEIRTTSFRPYVTTRVAGRNWFMAGEAASMPDPLTGNGLTSGIRHAQWATNEILAAGTAEEIAPGRARHYSRHVLRLGRSFNAHIENAIYRHPIRWVFGMPNATLIYTSFAFFMNALYTRFDPRGPIGMAVFDCLFVMARMWIGGWSLLARVALWFKDAPPAPQGIPVSS